MKSIASRLTAPLLVAALLGAAMPALASGSERLQLTDEVRGRITQTLTEQGYDVARIKMDDGYYEAYARKDGKKLEVYLDRDMKIVRVKSSD